MGQFQGQIPAEKQYGYVMEQNIIQKVIIKPQLVGLLPVVSEQKHKKCSNLIIVKILSHLHIAEFGSRFLWIIGCVLVDK